MECKGYSESLNNSYGDSVRATIRSGDANPLLSLGLGGIARKVVGTKAVRVLTSIDPSEVTAFGAAVWARLVQQERHRFMIEVGDWSDPPNRDYERVCRDDEVLHIRIDQFDSDWKSACVPLSDRDDEEEVSRILECNNR